jgi:hypothetical protein
MLKSKLLGIGESLVGEKTCLAMDMLNGLFVGLVLRDMVIV